MGFDARGMVAMEIEGRAGGNQPSVHLFLLAGAVLRVWELVLEYEVESTVRDDVHGFQGFYDFGTLRQLIEFDEGGKVVLSGLVYVVVKTVPKDGVGVTIGWLAVRREKSRGDNVGEDTRRKKGGVPVVFASGNGPPDPRTLGPVDS